MNFQFVQALSFTLAQCRWPKVTRPTLSPHKTKNRLTNSIIQPPFHLSYQIINTIDNTSIKKLLYHQTITEMQQCATNCRTWIIQKCCVLTKTSHLNKGRWCRMCNSIWEKLMKSDDPTLNVHANRKIHILKSCLFWSFVVHLRLAITWVVAMCTWNEIRLFQPSSWPWLNSIFLKIFNSNTCNNIQVIANLQSKSCAQESLKWK